MPHPSEYNWIFGRKAWLKFDGSTNAPEVKSGAGISTFEGSACISDSSGNLLFATDGRDGFDSSAAALNISPDLGGDPSTTHSAVIVPPAGGGSRYHVFAIQSFDSDNLTNVGPLRHSTFDLSGTTPIMTSAPIGANNSPAIVTEHLGAVPALDCETYWVIAIEIDQQSQEGKCQVVALKVTSDLGITSTGTAFPLGDSHGASGMLTISPDGKRVAIVNNRYYNSGEIRILNFDRNSGGFSNYLTVTGIANTTEGHGPYGAAFSPDSNTLYFSRLTAGDIYAVSLPSAPGPYPDEVFPNPSGQSSGRISFIDNVNTGGRYRAGQMRLAPNGRIYGVRPREAKLFEIKMPNTPLTAGFVQVATDVNGAELDLGTNQDLGLPTLTMFADDCARTANPCTTISTEVSDALTSAAKAHHNSMSKCDGPAVVEGDHPEGMKCEPLDLPLVEPHFNITWGDSKCDCIESDDIEVMTLTICNPYSNLTLANLIVHKIIVTDLTGNPVAVLPDGSPSVTLVPMGPYCFGNLEPCSCVSREFTLRLRGALHGHYKIQLSAVCFDVSIHQNREACFTFAVCKD